MIVVIAGIEEKLSGAAELASTAGKGCGWK